jgi:4-amino-4-deoxy-L-arabinose transferase-like glycosyltransferase
VLQAVLVGVLQPYLAFLIGRKIFGPMVGLAAAFVTAIYTYFIYYSATLMTEPFYIVAILASLLIAMQLAEPGEAIEGDKPSGRDYRLAVVLGLSLGAAILLRQLFLLMAPFIFLWVWWANRRRLTLPLLVTGVVILLMVVPFTIYNYQRFQRFVLLNTNAGYAFYWSNHPIYGTHFEPILPAEKGSYQDLIPQELHSLDEAALDQVLLQRGVQFILDDPARYILLSLSRIPPYFMFWPSSESGQISNLSRVTSFGLFLPFILYGLYRSVADRNKIGSTRPVILLYLFMGMYTLIHVLTWTLIRYRLPVDAVLVIFAGLALVDLVGRVPALRRLVGATVQS